MSSKWLGSLALVPALLLGCSSETVVSADADLDASSPDAADTRPDTLADALPDTSDVHDASDTSDAFPDAPFVLTIDDYPRVDGATATTPLDVIVAAELLHIPWHWECCVGEGYWERYVRPEGTLGDRLLAKIVHSKTHEAYVRLIDGDADLIFQASLPSAEERAYAASKGVTLEAKPIALDALIFVVNPANIVSSLTPAQIFDIYMGTITSWSQVGGAVQPIDPYSRPANSGSFELFNAMVLAGATMPNWPPDQTITYMGGLIYKIAEDPNGLGYSVYYYVTNIVPGLAGGTRVLEVGGVSPSAATIGARTYPYVAETYAVLRADLPSSSLARQLRDWLLTGEGQRIVGKTGYVPVGHERVPWSPER